MLYFDIVLRWGYRHSIFNDTIMKTIQFILSLLAGMCAAVMLYGAVVTYSPMKTASVTIMGVICIGCVSLMRITYKELE